MKRRIAVMFLFTALLVSVMGCQSLQRGYEAIRGMNPEQEYALAVLGYSYAIDTAVDLHDAGVITDEQYLAFNSLRVHVNKALEAWRTALDHGLDTEKAEKAYEKALARLTDVLPEDVVDDLDSQ